MAKGRADEAFQRQVLAMRGCLDQLGHLIRDGQREDALTELERARSKLFELVGAAEISPRRLTTGFRRGRPAVVHAR
jgi:hypothetical protein